MRTRLKEVSGCVERRLLDSPEPSNAVKIFHLESQVTANCDCINKPLSDVALQEPYSTLSASTNALCIQDLDQNLEIPVGFSLRQCGRLVDSVRLGELLDECCG